MSTIKYMGLEIQVGVFERKDGYISYIDRSNPDGVIKENFTVLSNDQSTFKEIDLKSPNFNFSKLEHQLLGLMFKFTEVMEQRDVVVIGFRFFQRPGKGMSSINVTKHRNTRGSHDLAIDFVRQIIQPPKRVAHDNKPVHKHTHQPKVKPPVPANDELPENIGNIGAPLYVDLTAEEPKPATAESLVALAENFATK